PRLTGPASASLSCGGGSTCTTAASRSCPPLARERRSSCGCPSAFGDESRPRPLSRRRYLFRLRVEPAASEGQRGSLQRRALASAGGGSFARASVDHAARGQR